MTGSRSSQVWIRPQTLRLVGPPSAVGVDHPEDSGDPGQQLAGGKGLCEEGSTAERFTPCFRVMREAGADDAYGDVLRGCGRPEELDRPATSHDGRLMSMMTRSGSRVRADSRPSLRLSAVSTTNPPRVSMVSHTLRASGSSSTIRIRTADLPFPSDGMGRISPRS